jgi:site-specific DNA recombinase
MNRAVGYIRVSTEEQSREGVSMEMQAAKIRAYCDLNDLELIGIVEDAGISGKSIKARPGIQTVLNMVTARKVDAVIVYKLDRLSRNTVETLNMVSLIDKSDVALHSITEKLDTQSAICRFVVRTLASLAEMERDLISERTTAALQCKKANGEKTGGFDPYGYRSVEGKLVADITEQQVLNRIKALRAAGESTRAIARKLHEEGLTTRKGTQFSQSQIMRILKAA